MRDPISGAAATGYVIALKLGLKVNSGMTLPNLDYPKWFAIVLSACAIIVSLYATTTGPRNTLHSERIKLAARVLQSTSEYGWEMGAFVGHLDREPFTIVELHEGEANRIMGLFNNLDADLILMQMMLPDKFLPEVAELRKQLAGVQHTFQAGQFSKLTENFNIFRSGVDAIRTRLRDFLGV